MTLEAELALERPGGFRLDVACTAPAQGVTALFGGSGCGKTTVLRCVAGLERARGHCRVQGETWQDQRRFLPCHRRHIGYVFREASLFPHLSIHARANLELGWRLVDPAERRIPHDTSILNILPARVLDTHDLDPAQLLVRLGLDDGQKLLARITRRSGVSFGLREGMPLYAQVKSVALVG